MKKTVDKNLTSEEAALSRRFFAYLIDWYVGGLVTALPIGLISQKLYGTMTNQNIMEFDSPFGVIGGVLAVIFGILYFVVIPLFVYRGQTPGKRICKIKIVKVDNSEVDIKSMCLRQIIGMIVIEGALVTVSAIWHQIFTIATGIDVVVPLMYAGMAVGAVSAVMVVFMKNHRAIHDYIGNTKVVSCK